MLPIYRLLINILFPIIVVFIFVRTFLNKEDKKDIKKNYSIHHLIVLEIIKKSLFGFMQPV